MFIIIVFWLGSHWPSGLLFFLPALTSFHSTPLFLPSLSISFSFHSCCSHAQVFGKTFVHKFPFSYRHTEWYTFFFFAKRHDRNGGVVTCRKLKIIIILSWFVEVAGWLVLLRCFFLCLTEKYNCFIWAWSGNACNALHVSFAVFTLCNAYNFNI